MRVLIVSVNHEHANSMHKENLNALSNVMEVDYYGPGYSSEQELDCGLTKYIKNHSPYDAVIITMAFILSSIYLEPVREIYNWHRYFLSRYTITHAVRYCGDIVEELKQMNDIVKVVFYNFDFVNMSERWHGHLQNFLENGFYILGPGSEFVPFVEENPDKWIFEKPITNYYHKLVNEYPGQWISFPYWAAAGNEFHFGNMENREHDWVIPGFHSNSYPERGKISKLLKSDGYKVWENSVDRGMAYKVSRKCKWSYCEYNNKKDRILNTVLPQSNRYISNHIKYEEIARFRENYQECLRNSKCAYADGGLGHTIVRKYIEIPAKGTVLVGEMVYGLDKLGFIPGVNIIEVSSKNVLSESKKLFADIEKMQKIADNGRSLVISKHTFRHRALAVRDALAAVCKGEYEGLYWEDGDFIIKKSKA